MGKSEQELESELECLLTAYGESDAACALEDIDVESVSSFADAGIMSMNKGLVVRCQDGSEFQLTIVRSS